jgi:hypothetical protein
MKYSFKNIPTIIILISITLYSCRKEARQQNTDANHLRFLTDKTIKINQAVIIYDSTVIKDSIDFIVAPSDKYYEWIIIPNNGCDSIVGNKNKGIVQFIFHCSGTYLVTAKIFDSLTHNLIGNTDNVVVDVTTDTLYPAQPIQQDDVLNMKPGIAKSWTAPHDPSNSPPDEINIQLVLLTSKLYDYDAPFIQFVYTSNTNADNYSYVFENTIKLNSYPFAYGYGIKSKVDGAIALKGLTFGVPANLSITWLGITYTGTVTLINENEYTFNWDNTGAVIIRS